MAINLSSFLQQTTLVHPASPDLPDDNLCPVCLESYLWDAPHEFPRRLPCGHILGTECLLVWAADQAAKDEGVTCPWCRRVVVDCVEIRGNRKAGGGNLFDLDAVAMRLFGVPGGGEGGQHWIGVLAPPLALGLAAMLSCYLLSDICPLLSFLSLVVFNSIFTSIHVLPLPPRFDFLLLHHPHDRHVLRRLFGAFLLVAGFLLGESGDHHHRWWLARAVLEVGKTPFWDDVFVRAYRECGWTVLLGAGAVVGMVGTVGSVGEGGWWGKEMVRAEAGMQALGCVVFWVVDFFVV